MMLQFPLFLLKEHNRMFAFSNVPLPWGLWLGILREKNKYQNNNLHALIKL